MPLVHILQDGDVWSLLAAALTLRHIGAAACICKAAERCVRQQRREWNLLHHEHTCNEPNLGILQSSLPSPRRSLERALSRLPDGTFMLLKPSGYSALLLSAQNIGMRQDDQANEFIRPQGVIFDNGIVYAFAACGKTVEKLRVSDGQVVGSCALALGGTTEAALSMSAGIAIARSSDGSHSLYVVDAGLHRVVEFSTTLSRGCAFGSEGNQPGQFSYPEGCCTTCVSTSGDDSRDRGRLFIADCFNHRVCVSPCQFTTNSFSHSSTKRRYRCPFAAGLRYRPIAA